jgi:nitric-oxide synthase
MLTDQILASTYTSAFALFASDAHYAPAVQLISLLTAKKLVKVRALKRFGVKIIRNYRFTLRN